MRNMSIELHALSPRWLQRLGETDRLLTARRMSGPGYIVLLDGEPLAAGGLGRIYGREYMVWCVITPRARASKLLMRRLTRIARELYPMVRELVGAEVVNAETRDELGYCRWLEG